MRRKAISKILSIVIVLVIVLVGIAYFFLSNQNQSTSQTIKISGAGSTFVAPFMQKLASEYKKLTGIEVDYSSIGSGAGIAQFLAKTVDFGASDAPLPKDKWLEAKDALHIPIIIGAVVPIYNIPELSNVRLKFTCEILANIYLGKITKWDDKELVNLNPELANIDKQITIVHRSDGSGTTYIWTDFLSQCSDEWRNSVGKGTSVNWPATNKIGGKGNEGVSSVVRNTPYTIGYVEFTYAVLNNIPYGSVYNPSSNEFVEPSIESIQKTVAYVSISLPKGEEDWSEISIINLFFKSAKNKEMKGAYPIVSFVYVFIYKELSKIPAMTLEKAKELVKFLKWAIQDGQKYAESLKYVPLPSEVVQLNLQTLSLVIYQGKSVL